MLSSFTKLRISASAMLLFTLISCGSELPIQDMNIAKREIGRAEALKAAEYAPDELAEAKKSLFQAHEKAAEENGSEAKKLANYATSKAYDALERTLPKLAAQSRDEATAAIDSADEAYATGLAPNEFDKAISLRKEGDQRMEKGDQALNDFLQERDEDKKLGLRQTAFQEYEASYNHYLESKKSAEEARTLSLNSRSELRQSARFVEEDLNTAETYLGGPNDKTQAERTALSSAYQDIDNGDLKKANEKIQTSRSNVRTILAISIQNYARERLQTATEVVEDSNAKFERIQEADIESNPQFRGKYESARENLGAANEALASAGNLYSQEKYEDSIKQSEEAIRLSEIVLDQSAPLSPEALAKSRSLEEKKSQASTSSKEGKTSSTTSSGKLNEGWSKYTVKRTNPEDCLWRIAGRKEFYGNAKLWPRIYQANKSQIRNKNLIYPNQVLYIPPKTGVIGSPYKPTDSQPSSTKDNQKLNLKDESTKPSSSNQSSPTNSGRPVNGSETEMNTDSGNEEELLDSDEGSDGEVSEDEE